MALTPKESGEHIVKNAKYVRVLPEGIKKLTQEVLAGILDKRIDVSNFSQHDMHPKPTDAYAAEWIFLVDTLNFCFWTPTNYTKYKVNGQTGYFALCAAVNRAIAEGVDITNAEFYSKIDAETLRHIFRSDDGDTAVPLFDKRISCLHEVGNRLLEKWSGKFENVVLAAKNSAKELLTLIVQEFPCFRDEADFAGQRVAIYKRAQILIGDLWACYRGVGLGAFNDLECITMFTVNYMVTRMYYHPP
ncbi:queuosine salvage protein-like [Teleopsis dalmanni]|uniref:queuosine salvage protein-like n=1 Tax=Teleopsis dalmanni TaxID=139649 RepID=UPI0018CF5440|nr:queuosine salvage protein-like [Teleopsis dalmanni]